MREDLIRAKTPFIKFFGGEVLGRNAQPIELLMAKGKKHLTKAEIEERKNSEIKVGSSKLTCPSYVKNDSIAYKKWKEIIKIYKDIDFVSSSDVGLLSRYCMTFSEYENLIKIRKNINILDFNAEDEEEAYKALEEVPEYRVKYILKKIEYILSSDGLLTLESAINKKMDMLIKMEDRLFLNPLAKVKNVPKQVKSEEQPESRWTKFGNRSG